ncbi:MAG: hypothetical protein II742_01930 [Clostridia bacterium]|nr:hypothetical protein [Clostridia bacterium]
MKKITAVLLCLIIALAFSACSKEENETPGEKTTKPVEVSGIGATAKITTTEDKNGVGTMLNDATIPVFSVDGQSAAIDAINARIETEVKALCDTAAAEPLQYAFAYTEIKETERYLQAIVTYGNALSLDGFSVASYVYDKASDKEATVNDAYAACDMTAGDFDKFVSKLFDEKGPAGTIEKTEVQGFAFASAGFPQFFVKITFDTGSDTQVEVITIVPETESFDPATDKVVVKD